MKRVVLFIGMALALSLQPAYLAAAIKANSPTLSIREIVEDYFTQNDSGAAILPPYVLHDNLGKSSKSIEPVYALDRSEVTVENRRAIVFSEPSHRAIGYYLISDKGQKIEGFALFEPVFTFGQLTPQVLIPI